EWEAHGHGQLHHAFAKLDNRSQDILQKRWLDEDKTTLQALAEHYHVSAERIRQIENDAIKKLKKHITIPA
ncbi:MAG: sigma factor-like helix-turn-helix DNA-binding protein, partial [Pseudomonadota bacterium]|nr:sigma factor-like helix-turn-helix DNA-binding protein [Pseudomonadota bacterium]